MKEFLFVDDDPWMACCVFGLSSMINKKGSAYENKNKFLFPGGVLPSRAPPCMAASLRGRKSMAGFRDLKPVLENLIR
jgi:hypothetical protein